ncbi:MAG: phosphatase PAP2 family protein [Methylotenera sp.]|nr:phosphatase PAP2 family protein [Oligoflexia bacterium]
MLFPTLISFRRSPSLQILLVSLSVLLLPDRSFAQMQTSVYRVSPVVDGSIIGVTALSILLPEINANHLIHPRTIQSSEVNSLDRSAIGNSNTFLDTTSDITTGAAVIAPVLLDWMDLGTSQEFLEDLTVYSETLSINGALVTLAKYTVQRPLPRTYAGDPKLVNSPGGYRSFYSGHTSLTMASLSAASMTLNLRHHSGALPWILTGAITLSVAAERVAAGRHFYTDVAVGAAAGALVGILVPFFHERRKRETSTSTVSFNFVPTPEGALAQWTRHF